MLFTPYCQNLFGLKVSHMRIFTFVWLLFVLDPAFAKPILTATCEEPIGSRFDQVSGKVEIRDDGFTGVRPVFILDDEKPGKLLFIWGPAQWAKDAGVETKALEAIIVSTTADKITAVRLDDQAAGVMQMFSLYPAKGLIYFTQHRYLNAAGGVPNSSTYYARCRFSG